MNDLFIYYVKGRIFEWTMALSMLFGGVELLLWDNVLTFGAFKWMLIFMSQKWIGSFMLFVGWFRISSLMFNGQLFLGRKIGPIVRSFCAVLSAALWAQFALALVVLSIDQGYPSLGVPFWSMFVVAELLVSYSLGAEWRMK